MNSYYGFRHASNKWLNGKIVIYLTVYSLLLTLLTFSFFVFILSLYADGVLMDELRLYVGRVPLRVFLWDRAGSDPVVHRGGAVQPGAPTGRHCSRWLLQLDLQLPHRHDLFLHTGKPTPSQRQHQGFPTVMLGPYSLKWIGGLYIQII